SPRAFRPLRRGAVAERTAPHLKLPESTPLLGIEKIHYSAWSKGGVHDGRRSSVARFSCFRNVTETSNELVPFGSIGRPAERGRSRLRRRRRRPRAILPTERNGCRRHSPAPSERL